MYTSVCCGAAGRGFWTCASITPLIVSWSIPFARACLKAKSRLGPTAPLVPAPVRVWQVPHFWVKSCWPLSRFAFGPRLQPVRATTATAAAIVADSQTARPWSLRRCMRAGILYVGADSPPGPVPGISLRRTARATAERRPGGGSRGHVERGPGRRARAHAEADRDEDDREGHRRGPGL